MDERRFDAVARAAAAGTSRRGVIRSLAGGALAGALGLVGIGVPGADGAQLDAEARGRRKKKKCRGKKRKCGKKCVNVKKDSKNCGKCGRTCAPGEKCRKGKCKGPKCGNGGACRVFITSSEHTGDLNGLAGADAICGNLAAQAGLPGTYKAWLSDSSESAADRLQQNPGPYLLVNGDTVANNWQDLTDGTILTAINRDEEGNVKDQTRVWTYTQGNGEANPLPNQSCADWENGATGSGETGFSNGTNATWTEIAGGFVNCTAALPLYCFQQTG